MTDRITIPLASLEDTNRLGRAIAERLRAGDVISLDGELGMGKTTLARAIITALGYRGEVPSPSFTIIEPYEPPALRIPVIHADFYRLEHAGDLLELGLDEYREGGVLIAEWAKKVGGFLHEPGCLAITLAPAIPLNHPKTSATGRIAIVKGGPDWLRRMPCL